jgi:hypothetical protein
VPVIACPSCKSKVKVPDDLAGRKAQCPRCRAIVARSTSVVPTVTAQPMPEKLPPAVLKKPRPMSKPVSPAFELDVAPAEVDEPAEELVPAEVDIPEEEEAAPARAKKKKKKKKPLDKNGATPSWVWWAGGLGVFFTLALVGVLMAARAGYGEKLAFIGINLAIMVPISTVIMILSMVISSSIAGGIDFGEIHTAILKAMALLIAVNLVVLIPLAGIFLTLPIWLFGLMYLYNLDFWECRFLLFINWAMNTIIKYLFMAALMSGFGFPVAPAFQFEEPPPKEPDVEEVEASLETIKMLGGNVRFDVDHPGFVIHIYFSGKPITDDDLDLLKNFPHLHRLELSKTQITDAGLDYVKRLSDLTILNLSQTEITDKGLAKLKGLRQLKHLFIADTKVTDAGVRDIKKALPDLTVVR